MRITGAPALLATVLLAGAVLTGCGEVEDRVDEAVDGVTDSAAAAAVERIVNDELEQRGITLQDPVECDPDVQREGTTLTGTIGCTATTDDGLDVVADFDGSVSTSGCDGTVVVRVGDETLVDAQAPDGCQVAG